jgi:hypothetical protein
MFQIWLKHWYNAEMKNAVFWDVMPRGSLKNQHFGGM